jgi:hypothetical protein
VNAGYASHKDVHVIGAGPSAEALQLKAA